MGRVRARAKCLDIIQNNLSDCKSFFEFFSGIFVGFFLDYQTENRRPRRGGGSRAYMAPL